MTARTDQLHRPQYMPDLLIRALDRNADRPALHLGETTLTAGELRDAMSRFVQALASLGVGKGTAASMLARNRPEVLISMGSTIVAGCRNTALNPNSGIDDHAYIVGDAQIEMIVFDPRHFEDHVAELVARCPSLTTVLSLGPSKVGTDILALAEGFDPAPLVAAEVDGEDASSLVYTGGTTGRPKGVVNTFRSGVTLPQIQMSEWQIPDQMKFLVCTPLSHAGAAFFLPTLLAGGALVVLEQFSPAAALEAIEKYRIDATMLVPTMIYMLLDHPDIETRDLSSLQTIYYGAAAMSPARLREGIDKLGPVFFQFYGQSECGMSIAVLRKEEHLVDDPARLASCGRPVPWLDVRLLDDDLNEVPVGELGEICVRGPLVMQGYWNKPAETAEALEGGWLHTGDIARRDAAGFLSIVDRKKDMIVSGGFNVYPGEIEDVISALAEVADVAVIGAPDAKWGESVTACVVLRAGHGETEAERARIAAEIAREVKAQRGSVEAPKAVDFLEAIPVTGLGKPDKKALRARYWEGADRLV